MHLKLRFKKILIKTDNDTNVINFKKEDITKKKKSIKTIVKCFKQIDYMYIKYL